MTGAFDIVEWAIFVFGAFRAVQIGRALVTPTYRSRAFWTAAVMLVFVFASCLDAYVAFFSTPQASVGYAALGAVPSVAEIVLLFAFIDSTVLSSMEMDFFHRDTLGWKRLRAPLYVAVLLSMAGSTTLSGYIPTTSSPETALGFVATLGILGFSVAALIVSARRTPDRTMKRFVRLLGLALAFFVTALVVVITTPGVLILALDFVSGVLFLTATYLLYRAVMSLSPLGKLTEESDATPG